MIGLSRIDVVTACRLDADRQIAEHRQRQGKALALRDEIRIGLRLAPACAEFFTDRGGQFGERRPVVVGQLASEVCVRLENGCLGRPPE